MVNVLQTNEHEDADFLAAGELRQSFFAIFFYEFTPFRELGTVGPIGTKAGGCRPIASARIPRIYFFYY